MSSLPEKLRFTVDDYYRMAEVGILEPDARVELIDGEILRMSPMGSRHAGCVMHLNNLFARTVGERAVVTCQTPLRLSETSEPEPDVCLLEPRDDFYSTGHPGPEDVLLLVEVSDSSAGFDRRVKQPLYAQFGVAELWIVDVEKKQVDVHRRPEGNKYRYAKKKTSGEVLSPTAFPDLEIPVDVLLP